MRTSVHRKSECRKILDVLCAEFDGTERSLCRSILSHITSCEGCASFLVSLEKLIRFYQTYPTPRMRTSCRKELLSSIRSLSGQKGHSSVSQHNSR